MKVATKTAYERPVLRRKPRGIVAIPVAVLLIVAFIPLAFRHRVRVTISKETTYLTEPLRPDGSVNYWAGLNRICSEGVTPDNNASVLFWQAAGPENIEASCRKDFFAMLGMAEPPATGDYFIPRDGLFRSLEAQRAAKKGQPSEATDAPETNQEEANWTMLDTVMKRPWSREEFPELAAWLDRNEKPLALIVKGTQRPRRYEPLFKSSGQEDPFLLESLLPGSQQSRDFGRALIIRAMLRLKEDQTDAAWNDLLACHRLGRLIGQGPSLVDGLVAAMLEGMAIQADQNMLRHVQLNAEQIAKMRVDLDQLAAMPRMADKINLSERIFYLDAAMHVARHGIGVLYRSDFAMRHHLDSESALSTLGSVASAVVDWDTVLRTGNARYDEIFAAFRKPTVVEQREAFDQIGRDLDDQAAQGKDWASILSTGFHSPRNAITEETDHVLQTILLPAFPSAWSVDLRWEMQVQLNKLAFALAAYRADQGRYPEKLADLAPKYVAEIPKDPFTDTDLFYEQDGNGYLMYSLGPNGNDDGGKTIEDRSEAGGSEGWDDITVRMSAPKPK